MRFTFELTARDRARAIRVATKRQRSWRLLIGIVAVGVVLEVASGYWGGTSTRGGSTSTTGVPLSVMVMNLIPYVFIIALWIILFRRMFRGYRTGGALGQRTIELTDEAFNETTPLISLTVKWANILRVVESKEYFLFFVPNGNCMILPRSAVPLDQVSVLRAFLASRLPADRTEFGPPPVSVAPNPDAPQCDRRR